MFLLTGLIVIGHILAGIDFIFLRKTSQIKLEKLSILNLGFSEKIRKVVSKQDKFLHHFAIAALILS